MKKRILSLALAFFLVAALLPLSAYASSPRIVGESTVVSTYTDITGFVDDHCTLWMWGTNSSGALGNGTEEASAVPIPVLDNVAAVSCGMSHTAAIKTDGTLWTWGDNWRGQLGCGAYNNERVLKAAAPIKILDNVTAVSCGAEHTAAVKTDGTLWMWGDNFAGQLGNGGGGDWGNPTHFHQSVPIKVMDNVAAVSCGMSHTAAVKTDGTLWIWGDNTNGGLGNGTTERSTTPIQILDNVAAVSCGYAHTAAIKTDGTLWMWGDNQSGQLGSGTNQNSTVPIQVLDNVTAASCGFRHTAAIKTDGTLWMWGENSWGQLCNGTNQNSTVPIQVLDNVTAVSCGTSHTAATRSNGTFWMWGESFDFSSQTPTQIAGLTAYLERPTYRYPTADPAADSAAKSASEAAGGGDSSTVYMLADGLYYVLVEKDGFTTGAVVKGVKEKGAVVWKVIQTHEEPASQEELDRLVAQEQSTSNLPLDFARLSTLTTPQAVADYLQDRLDNLDGLTVNDPAKSELALFLENAMASLASAPVSGPGNRLTVSAGTISSLASQAQSAKAQLDELLTRNGITLNKELEILLRVLWQDVDGTAPCQVTLDRDLANGLGGNSLRVLLGDDRHTIQLSADTVSGLVEQYGTLSIQMSQNGENTYTINFLDSTGTALEQISLPVMIGLPASGPLNTIMVSYANGSDNWGGQYDESTRSITFETQYSGQYEVLENDVAISDIGDLDQELQTAIKFLVSKGYMNAPDGVFSPENPLSRYDFTQALVGMFFALDRSLEVSFPDVPKDSAYYSHVASAQADHIVEGFEDGTFSGDKNITVEQMLALAARTLRERKGYLTPGNEDSYLTSFSDADQIAGWAKQLVAQTVRDEIMDRVSVLNPQGEVPRAQAALILYRLFLRLYEVSPVALELPDVVETEPPVVETPAPVEDEAGGFPLGPVVAAVAVAAAGGTIGAGVYFKKKNDHK